MKAAQYNAYGDTSVIELNENTPEPTLKPGQVLVDNHYASINAIDWKVRAGYMQQMMPVAFPATLGGDFSGTIISVAEGVTEFKEGDSVYGQAIILNGGSGTIAEMLAANTKNIALKPSSVDFDSAAALPLVAVSALQALVDHINLQSGQKILIHGGAGGIGHIAIQIAKALGAYVATTVKTEDVEFVKGLGADEVIDYKTQDFSTLLSDYDAVYDNVGGETAEKSFGVLKKGGVLVSMVGGANADLATKFGVTALNQMTNTDTPHLQRISEMVDAGKVKVHVDRIFPLVQVQEAFAYQEKSHPNGKVLIQIK